MSPALISRYTVMVETRINSATSATVRNRAFASDSTLASPLRACWHGTPLWLLWRVSNEHLSTIGFGALERAHTARATELGEVFGSAPAELPGALRRFPHGLDEGAAHAPALEGAKGCRRRAAWGRDGGPVLLGGLAGLGEEAGRAEQRLHDEGLGRRPRQADEHTRFDEGLGHE